MSEPEIVLLNDRTACVGPWNRIDAVVFVHGIAGNFRETWGSFPHLIATDPDLPELDILLWGYRTTLLPADVHDTATIARHLFSELRVRLVRDVSAHLVAHSMGGLIVCEGLVQEMRQGRAQVPPTSNVRHLSLFAVPTSGSAVADAAAAWIESLGLPGGTLNDQIRSLGTAACDALIAEVTDRVYGPTEEGRTARRIPIRMVVAGEDSVVDDQDADMSSAPFQDPPALELPYGHSDLKLPCSHYDVRYLALANDVQVVVCERFAEIARRFFDGEADERQDAETDLEIRYGSLLRRRYVRAGGDPGRDPEGYAVFCKLVMRDCLASGRAVFDCANRATVAARKRGYLAGDG